jgi:hypothetical protein
MKSNVLFNEIQSYFFITEFQNEGLAHDHGLVWVQNVHKFGISSNETIEFFFEKYLTTNQTLISIEICNAQIHQHKQPC